MESEKQIHDVEDKNEVLTSTLRKRSMQEEKNEQLKQEKIDEITPIDYDLGDWYIDDDLELIQEHDPHITLSEEPELWVQVDDSGFLDRLMTPYGELSENNHELPKEYKRLVGQREHILKRYYDPIRVAEAKMMKEYAEAYRKRLSEKGITGNVYIVINTGWMSTNRYNYVKQLAEPLRDQYIVLIS